MDNQQINKALHGVISKECWHEIDRYDNQIDGPFYCSKCNHWMEYSSNLKNPDYFSKKGFWDVLKYAKEQSWWFKFNGEFFLPAYIKVEYVDYETFAKHLYDFLVSEGIISQPGSPEA